MKKRKTPPEKIAALRQEIALLEQAQNQRTKIRLQRLAHDLKSLIDAHQGQPWVAQANNALNGLNTAANQVPVPKEQ